MNQAPKCVYINIVYLKPVFIYVFILLLIFNILFNNIQNKIFLLNKI